MSKKARFNELFSQLMKIAEVELDKTPDGLELLIAEEISEAEKREIKPATVRSWKLNRQPSCKRMLIILQYFSRHFELSLKRAKELLVCRGCSEFISEIVSHVEYPIELIEAGIPSNLEFSSENLENISCLP